MKKAVCIETEVTEIKKDKTRLLENIVDDVFRFVRWIIPLLLSLVAGYCYARITPQTPYTIECTCLVEAQNVLPVILPVC